MAFYRGASSQRLAAGTYEQRLARDIEADYAAIAEPRFGVDPAQIAFIHSRQTNFLFGHRDWLEKRVPDGRIVEAHGDLRPEHICLTSVPVIIDCLEFNREFRLLDPVHEIAYLAIECDQLNAPFVDSLVFVSYFEGTGDSTPRSLVEFYKSEWALLRVKLALWHLRDQGRDDHAKWIARAHSYLDLATRYCTFF